jgi:hypothetical protein
VIVYRNHLARRVTTDQVGIYPRHLFRDESILALLARIVLVAERHRAQFHQRFTGTAHVADVAFVARRGDHDAELSAVAHHHRIPGYHAAKNAGEESLALSALAADPNSTGLSRDVGVADQGV